MKKLILILLAGITIQANAETNKEIKFRAYNKDKIIYIIPKDTPKWCIKKAKEATKKAIEELQKERNEPYWVCRRSTFLRECSDEKIKLYP